MPKTQLQRAIHLSALQSPKNEDAWNANLEAAKQFFTQNGAWPADDHPTLGDFMRLTKKSLGSRRLSEDKFVKLRACKFPEMKKEDGRESSYMTRRKADSALNRVMDAYAAGRKPEPKDTNEVLVRYRNGGIGKKKQQQLTGYGFRLI